MNSYRNFVTISEFITLHARTEREVVEGLKISPYRAREVLEWLSEHEIAKKIFLGSRLNRRDDHSLVKIFSYVIEKRLPEGYVDKRRRDYVRAMCAHERKSWSAAALTAAW